MRKVWKIVGLLGLLSVIVHMFLPSESLSAESINDVKNSSFEHTEGSKGKWDGEKAVDWSVWKPTGNPNVSVVNDHHHSGTRSLEISAIDTGRAAVSQDIDVIGGNTYKFSAWIKTDNVTSTQGARLRATYYSGDNQMDLIYSRKVKGTQEWTYIEKVLTPPEDVDRIRVQNFLEKGTGTAWFDDVTLTKIVPLEEINIVQDQVTIKENENITLEWSVLPEDSTSGKVEWVSTDQNVATVQDGNVTGINTGTTAVIAVSEDKSISDFSIIKVEDKSGIPDSPIDNIQLETDDLELQQGHFSLLEAVIEPSQGNESNLVWRSTNKEVVKVDGGLVHAIAPGKAKIIAENEDGSISDERTVHVKAANEDQYDDLRKKWNEHLLGTKAFDSDDPRMKEIIKNKTTKAETLWRTMVKNKDRSYLWVDMSSETNPADITHSYRNIYRMAEMFSTEGSSLYHDPELLSDILSGLEWMYKNRYNEDMSEYGNWWHWEIGTPKSLNNIVSIMYPFLRPDEKNRYMTAIDHFQPDPTKSGATTPDRYRESLGANRIDTSKVVAVRGIIMKESDKIAASRDALSQVFEYVEEENGFYRDGSFVQHEDIPYNGSYGIVLIEGLTEMLQLLSGSTWEVTDSQVKNVYKWIEDSFEPFMYKGALMDMVRGRAISRSFLQDHVAGKKVIETVLRMSTFAPEPYATKYKEMAKYWIEEDDFLNYTEQLSNFNDMNIAERLLENDQVTSRGELYLHKTFANMDRVVTRKPGYAFGISMYSDRIQNYEDMNNENRKGWYTSAGMTYLYNGDLKQYSDGFWATVDPYRMPGTTVDTMKRTDGSGEHRSKNSWVGGSTLNSIYGTAGMNYDAWNSSLTAKKSWFMFDDEIVALGAGISSEEERNIETIIENRKIRKDASNNLIVNGELLKGSSFEKTKDNVKWAYLEGNKQGSSIGYYFPDNQRINVKKDERQGAWQDINYKEPDKKITRSYATMWFDHGVKPQNQTYSYVLLPNRKEKDVRDYASRPEIEILRNDTSVQAVKEGRTLEANFWKDQKESVGPLTVYNKASVSTKEGLNTLEIAVSDPTMKNDGFVELEFDQKVNGVIEADERVEVLETKPKLRLKVNVKDAKGKSIDTKLSTNNKYAKHTDNFSIESMAIDGDIHSNGEVEGKVKVKNNKNAQTAKLTLAFYDWQGNLIKYVNEDIHPKRNSSQIYNLSIKLPDNITGGSIRSFVWKGNSLESAQYKRLSNVAIH